MFPDISDGQAVLAVGNLIQGNIQKLNGPMFNNYYNY